MTHSDEISVAKSNETADPSVATTDDVTNELEQTKLRLEIEELRRSPWGKPAVIVPIGAALFTLAISQYLGVFDVERKRVEISAKDAEMRRTRAEDSINILRIEKQGLIEQRKALEDKKAGLAIEVSRLQEQVRNLNDESVKAGIENKKANQALLVAHREIERTKRVLARPDLNISREILPGNRNARLYINNNGKGGAVVHNVLLYVDGKRIPKSQGREPVRDALNIMFGSFAPWINWYFIEGDTIPSGGESVILWVDRDQFSESRSDEFYTATERLGVEVCYCSAFDDCYWATYHRPMHLTGPCLVGSKDGGGPD